MGAHGKQASTPATALLAHQRVPHTVHSYEHDPRHPSYGAEATEILGLEPHQVFKTLVADVDGQLTIGVVPVAAQLDLKALAAAVGGKKAKMADVTAAERATGYVAGGISPLGLRKRLPVVLDVSAVDLDTVFCSGGRRGLEIELAPGDLATLANAVVAPIATTDH
jgi:Cys-tRNA(Pro)/Cys-tRNA(Cys) deacylase